MTAAAMAAVRADRAAAGPLARREALWQARALAGSAPLPLFARDMEGEGIAEPAVTLPQMSLGEEMVEDYVHLRLSLRAHPMALLRARLTPGFPPPDAGNPYPPQNPVCDGPTSC